MSPRLLACFGRRGGATASAPDNATTAEGEHQEAAPGPVLVELFTSQGCGASPEANAVVARLAQDSGDGAAVVVLAFHVDYWDYRGWMDPFAYEPQPVADGDDQGSMPWILMLGQAKFAEVTSAPRRRALSAMAATA